MKKYHMTDDGPKICTASKVSCPIGGFHGTLEEVLENTEKVMSSKTIPEAFSKKTKIEPFQKEFLNAFDDSAYALDIRKKLDEYPNEINGNPVAIHVLSGSNLYGLAHSNSDFDTFTVLLNKKENNKKYYIKQSINGADDTVLSDFRSFVLKANEGTPQFLEAMFAPDQSNRDKTMEAFRNSYHAGSNAVDVYRRTIKNFAIHEDLKRKRHALRLVLNLNEMIQNNGRFNPVVPIDKAKEFTDVVSGDLKSYFKYLEDFSKVEIDFDQEELDEILSKEN